MLKLEMPMLREVLEPIGGNERLLEEQSKKFRLWLKQQLHLPQDISDQRLKFFISAAKFDFEKAKKRLDMLYTLRNLVPEIYGNLDPFNDRMIQFHKYFQWVVLPKLTPEKYRINICRILDTDTSIFEPWMIVRYGTMTLETRIEEDIVNSDIVIWDCSKDSMAHILKYTPTLFKKVDSCMEAYGLRVKAIYLINAPNIIDLSMSIVKSVMKAKIFNRIHIYTSGMEALNGIISKSILPADYGGEQPSMSTLTDMWRAKHAERRDWFLKEEKRTANESLRTNSIINPNDLFGVSGTFRKLEID